MKARMLAVLLALPLLAFDCGGEEDRYGGWGPDPFGLGCRLHVSGGGLDEDMWCIMSAYDYAPEFATSEWVFDLAAYRGFEVGAGAGLFLEGRPALGTTYGWSGAVASSALLSGGAQRYGGSMMAGTYVETHDAVSLGAGYGTGSLAITFSQIPPPGAVGEQLIGVHGSLTATLPSDAGGPPVTLTATF